MILYHSTTSQNEKSVLENGLIAGSPDLGFTDEGIWASRIYGIQPIYLSVNKPWCESDGLVHFMVNGTGLNLRPDLPSLVDAGAYLEEEGMWWEEGQEPASLLPYLEDGFISYKKLINEVPSKAFIEISKTACVTENISPEMMQITQAYEQNFSQDTALRQNHSKWI